MDRTCVPKRITVMELAINEPIDDEDRAVSWNTTQNVEVVVGPDPTVAGREQVVQLLVPALYVLGKHFKGKHPPIPKSQYEFTGRAFAFNSCPFTDIDFRYVAAEVDIHRHLYKQAFIGFEPVRLALLHNAPMFKFYDDDSVIPTPLKILYDTACSLFGGLADLIAVNSIRRRCEEIQANQLDRQSMLDMYQLIARKQKDPRVESAMLETAASWTEWGKRYLPQAFLEPIESKPKPKKKKGKKNAGSRRPKEVTKKGNAKVSKNVKSSGKTTDKNSGGKKVSRVRKDVSSRNKKNVR